MIGSIYCKPQSLAVYRLRFTLRSPSRLRFSTEAAKNQLEQTPRWCRRRGFGTALLIATGVLVPSVAYLQYNQFERDLRIYDPEQVSLRNTAWPNLGISQISIGKCSSNNPGEDTMSILRHRKFGFFGIYDGHNGGDLSKSLCDTLLPNVRSAINKVYYRARQHLESPDEEKNSTPRRPSSEDIDNAITRVFVDLDDDIVHRAAQKALNIDDESYNKLSEGNQESSPPSSDQTFSRLEAVKTLKLANAGSCVIVGMFDSEDRSLRIALTGDLRAVFGRRVLRGTNNSTEEIPESKRYVYEAEALTADQNAHNSSEAARLSAEHPGEEGLLSNGRVLGWGPSRAFGDGIMKWSRAVRERLAQQCLGDTPRSNYKTPPYFTAEPVITVKEGIQKGDFVVLASDGLWECFGNEEVVGLIGQWLETHGTKDNLEVPGSSEVREIMVPPKSKSSYWTKEKNNPDGKIYAPSDLPVIYPSDYKDKTVRYRDWRAEKKFVCEDKDSVAHHLLRNALGGADKDLRDALLEYTLPRSRRFRDDISVIVVFFD